MATKRVKKTFSITVPARRETINGMVIEGSFLRTDDFEDGVIDSSIQKQSADAIGTVEETNGVLKVTRQADGGDNAVFLTYPPNRLAEGDFLTEFTLEKKQQQSGNLGAFLGGR